MINFTHCAKPFDNTAQYRIVIYSQQIKCFWKRYNAAWRFWRHSSSFWAVLPTAVYSISELRYQDIRIPQRISLM
jgi:hypothetical protein